MGIPPPPPFLHGYPTALLFLDAQVDTEGGDQLTQFVCMSHTMTSGLYPQTHYVVAASNLR
jgi:hypothetical protein